MIAASCPTRALSGKRSISGQSESWPDRGAPERPTGCWQKVERREAQRPPSMGARGFAIGPREAGPLIPPQRGA